MPAAIPNMCCSIVRLLYVCFLFTYEHRLSTENFMTAILHWTLLLWLLGAMSAFSALTQVVSSHYYIFGIDDYYLLLVIREYCSIYS